MPIEKIFSLFYMEEDTVILESSLQNQLGRFSIIGRLPFLKLVKGKTFTVNGDPCAQSFEEYVNDYLKVHLDDNPTDLPLVSGAIGFFSYDYNRGSFSSFPECILMFYDQFIIQDHEKQEIYLTANGHLQDSDSAIDELTRMIYDKSLDYWIDDNKYDILVSSNFEKEEYKKAIEDMKKYIIEGDIYVANLTQRLDIKSRRQPYEVYSRLRINNPAPFAAYMNYGDFQIICASPERFLRMKNRKVVTRPIKGTRKRGDTPGEDLALKRKLENSIKDRSELLMIVDLKRNDLNRVCNPGSVKVDELFTVESYATVHHLVSSISGILSDDLTAIDLLNATFPGGSVTGAPKIRAMEIIEELEHGNRGLYTGCIGYISLNGDCDFNIVIRTAIYHNGIYSLGVGGGITFESDLESEYEETLQKAKAILESLS